MKAPAAVAPHRPDVFSTPHQLMTNHHLHITIGHQAVMIKIMNKIMIILVIWWCEWCWIDRRGLANGLFTSSPRTMASATTYTYYYHHCYRYQNHAKLREAINIEKKDFWGNHFIKWWQAPPPVLLLWSPYLFCPIFERKETWLLVVKLIRYHLPLL